MISDLGADGWDDFMESVYAEPEDIVAPMTEAVYTQIAERMNESATTDVVNLTTDALLELAKYWRKDKEETYGPLSADIIIEETIPIMDMKFVFSGPGEMLQHVKIAARVVIFDNTESTVAILRKAPTYASENDTAIGILGAVSIDILGSDTLETAYPLVIVGEDSDQMVLLPQYIYPSISYKQAKQANAMKAPFRDSVWVLAMKALYAWYGAQLSLLHPLTKTVLSRGRFQKADKKERLKKVPGKKKVAKYVKVHRIDDFSMDDVIRKAANEVLKSRGTASGVEKRKYERKRLLWRVVGYYKSGADGKPRWVKPHWRGPMKDFVRPEDVDPQDREIPITGKKES